MPRLPTAVLSTGLMLVAFLSIACGLILDTVTRGRREMKLLAYLAHRPRRKSGSGDMTPEEKLAPDLIRVETGFPAVAKPASAGEGRSDKVMV